MEKNLVQPARSVWRVWIKKLTKVASSCPRYNDAQWHPVMTCCGCSSGVATIEEFPSCFWNQIATTILSVRWVLVERKTNRQVFCENDLNKCQIKITKQEVNLNRCALERENLRILISCWHPKCQKAGNCLNLFQKEKPLLWWFSCFQKITLWIARHLIFIHIET